MHGCQIAAIWMVGVQLRPQGAVEQFAKLPSWQAVRTT
jgi:hypothetical protein